MGDKSPKQQDRAKKQDAAVKSQKKTAAENKAKSTAPAPPAAKKGK